MSSLDQLGLNGSARIDGVAASYDAQLLEQLRQLAAGGPTAVGGLSVSLLATRRGQSMQIALALHRSSDELVRRIFGEPTT